MVLQVRGTGCQGLAPPQGGLGWHPLVHLHPCKTKQLRYAAFTMLPSCCACMHLHVVRQVLAEHDHNCADCVVSSTHLAIKIRKGFLASGAHLNAFIKPTLLCCALQAAKNQAALAAAKARFEQQQKENDEIAERSKRQRLGLPEPRPPVPEVSMRVVTLMTSAFVSFCDCKTVVIAVAHIMAFIVRCIISIAVSSIASEACCSTWFWSTFYTCGHYCCEHCDSI